tara:strand:- start:20 stop:526 length:507 start_codon:yes stop_codon:yes gene_type:complete
MVSGGIRKAQADKLKIQFSSKVEEEAREYKDTFPDELPTLADVKNQYGVVVWCKYKACTNNQTIEGLQRTSGTLLNKRGYTPLNEQEAIWPGICTRNEIAINYTETVTARGNKMKVPSCFVAATNNTGHIDFSRLLQSDGSPLGGNIDSQHPSDAGYGAADSSNIYEY